MREGTKARSQYLPSYEGGSERHIGAIMSARPVAITTVHDFAPPLLVLQIPEQVFRIPLSKVSTGLNPSSLSIFRLPMA